MCYFICEHRFNEFFGAGCNSLPAVKVRDPRKWLTWCNSKTDSIVWMVEDVRFDLLRRLKDIFFRVIF